jgi:LAO/AO transport system kinase
MRRERALEEVAIAFEAGDVRALSRAVSWIEDGDPRGRAILRRVFPRTGRARLVGVTGSPGAGKSTLVDRLAVRLAESGRRVAVVAVDPSSAYSGGALLGDRIRMTEAAALPNVYVRSMATRGNLGGLARATEDACDLLDAFGFDDVLVETVGVGQDEIEVVSLAHVVVVVLVPFMGDDVQTIKAGIMEIADAYVVNKADRDGADRMEAYLKAMLGLYDDGAREIPVLRTVATRGEGVAELVATIDRLAAAKGTSPGREARAERRILALLRDLLLERRVGSPSGRAEVRAAVRSVVARETDPHAAAERLAGPAVRMDHLGIAVKDREEALRFWRDALGLEVAHEEEVASEDVRVTMLPVGESRVELLEPSGAEGAVQGFLAKRGPGIHHACFAVPDIEAALARLRAAGARILGEAPRKGAGGKLVAFVHPASTAGVLVEISQDDPDAAR